MTTNANLLTNLIDDFSQTIRSRGNKYVQQGRVQLTKFDDFHALATVEGSDNYVVLLRHEQDSNILEADCSCPYISNYGDLCKHIWATIMTIGLSSKFNWKNTDKLQHVELMKYRTTPTIDVSPIDHMPQKTITTNTAKSSNTQRRNKNNRNEEHDWSQPLDRILKSTWLQQQDIQPWPSNREILYLIDMNSSRNQPFLGLRVATREPKLTGGWKKPQRIAINHNQFRDLPNQDDIHILSLLSVASNRHFYGGSYSSQSYYAGYNIPYDYEIPPGSQALLTELICRTGRAHLMYDTQMYDLSEPILWDDDQPWNFQIHAEIVNEQYCFEGQLVRDKEQIDINTPALCLEGGIVVFEHSAARLNHHNATEWLTHLQEHGPLSLPVGREAEILDRLSRIPHSPPMQLPESMQFEEVPGSPVPRVSIQPNDDYHWRATSDLVGHLSFNYNGHIIHRRSIERGVYDHDSNTLILRNIEAERDAENTMRAVGFKAPPAYSEDQDSLRLPPKKLTKATLALIDLNWVVEAKGKLYRQPADFKVNVTSETDWFELDGSCDFDGQQVQLPALLKAIHTNQRTVKLDDGTHGVIPEQWLKQYGLLAGLGEIKDDKVRFKPAQAAILDVLLEQIPEVNWDKAFAKTRKQLTSFDGIKPKHPPKSFQGELRPYQREGLGWIHFLREFSFGGCLADDMGLGKTVQVLSLLEARRKRRAKKGEDPASAKRPSIVIVPKSLVFNWQQEAARFTPKLRVSIHTGKDRPKSLDDIDQCDLMITTYGTLRRDITMLKNAQFDYAILDEAQAIKNAKTASSKAVRLLNANHRLALSGTPIENHLGELWALFEFLNPGLLGKASIFGLTSGANQPDDDTAKLLSRALRPFILRRTKTQVAKDLPEKSEQTIFCDLLPKQQKQYNELRDHYRASLLKQIDQKGLNKSKFQVLEALLRLRQAACHPGLIDNSRINEPCAKIDILIPQLQELVEEGHKALIFSQFTSFLSIIRSQLDKLSIPYLYLDGQTRDRQSLVDQFQNETDPKLFLISLKAGGLGLNLTAAEYVFLLDPWWNPAVEAQAIDRAYRIGQQNKVFASRIISRDTVEEKVLQLQQTKRDLADAILSADKSLIRSLTSDDLKLLLS